MAEGNWQIEACEGFFAFAERPWYQQLEASVILAFTRRTLKCRSEVEIMVGKNNQNFDLEVLGLPIARVHYVIRSCAID